MVLHQAQTDALFRALADATRRDIVARVLVAEQTVSALAARYAMSFAAVQKHVAVLERAELVSKHRVGREARVRGNVATLKRASALLAQLERVWRDRFAQIDDLIPPLDPGEG
ncbi:MAG: transcriptional regulator [Deltaproteobacteria bacterium HGW-Deltaproteobacteria-14]|jgi:DNA-binding transcriptional ArsR family regulator|nr:MAG: transcriptional regulator [Deltaproteobacteria bacterium HGW-Deltaproteobacteria-14]